MAHGETQLSRCEVSVLSTPSYLHHLEPFLSSYHRQLADVPLTVVHSGGNLPLVPDSVRAITLPILLGCGAARECARATMTADWLMFTDSDVRFPDGFGQMLCDAIRAAEERGCAAVQLDFRPSAVSRLGHFEYLLDRSVLLSRSQSSDSVRWWHERAPGEDGGLTTLTCMQGFGMLLRREALARVGGFDPRLDSGEDRDIAAKLTTAKLSIMFSKSYWVLHDYNFSLLRIVRRKAWHGKFSAVTSQSHPELFAGSIVSCVRMLSVGILSPPAPFRSAWGRVYFAVQAFAFCGVHIAYSLLLTLHLYVPRAGEAIVVKPRGR